MLRTVLPALGRAIVMNSFWNCHNKEPSENWFKEKLEVSFNFLLSSKVFSWHLSKQVCSKDYI